MRIRLLFFLGYCFNLHAQDSTIIIKAGKSFTESVPITDIYQYAQFTNGKVFFKAGDSTSAKLNYHKFLDAMQFIDLKGDTLKIANAALIKFIRINNDVFYFDEQDGFVNLIKESNGIKLAAKRTLRMKGRSKIGAYGMESPSNSIATISTLNTQTNNYNLVPMEDITLSKKTEYYFGDKYNQFALATKKTWHSNIQNTAKNLLYI